jgi:hypothetical protein
LLIEMAQKITVWGTEREKLAWNTTQLVNEV